MDMSVVVTDQQSFNNVSELLRLTDVRMYRAVEHVLRNELALRPIDSLAPEAFRLLAKTALDMVQTRVSARYLVAAGSFVSGKRLYLLTTGFFGEVGEGGNVAARFGKANQALEHGRQALNRATDSYVMAVTDDYLAQFE